MNQYELETFELIIEVYDYNAVLSNVLIGSCSIGLSTLYRNLNHEFHRVWLALTNPEEAPNNEVQGYL
jgi:Ca2+-dependent lipid-binding protein